MIRKSFKTEKKSLRKKFQDATENFVGIGLGNVSDDNIHGENCIRIFVTKLTESHKKDTTYKFKDGQVSQVQYVETGDIDYTGFTGRIRPAAPGAVVGAVGNTAKGTFGAMVTDNTDGAQVLLSASHVIAKFGLLPLGTNILQPGPGNGGVNPTDVIATLKRFVPNQLSRNGINYVDVAIATPSSSSTVSAVPLCAQINPTTQGAIGMLYAASPLITVINPIQNILTMMNVSVPKSITATPGMSIHCCSAITGYFATTVSDVMVDLFLGNVWWMDQTVCAGGALNGVAGDSGAMFYTTFAI